MGPTCWWMLLKGSSTCMNKIKDSVVAGFQWVTKEVSTVYTYIIIIEDEIFHTDCKQCHIRKYNYIYICSVYLTSAFFVA